MGKVGESIKRGLEQAVAQARGSQRPADFDALPRRHRDYVAALEAELHSLRALQDKEAPTRVFVREYGSEAVRFLRDNARVAFMLKPHGALHERELEVTLARGGHDGTLEISAPNGRLVVMPEVSNVVRVSSV